MSTTNSIPKGISININKKNYPSVCRSANILEVVNNPYLDIESNILHIKVNLIYLDPTLDKTNPLNYLIVNSENLAIKATGIFSIGNLETSIESLLGITPNNLSWIDYNKYYMYNIVSYNSINYCSIIDTNLDLQPDINNTIYSNAWASFWDASKSYIIGNCVYRPYTDLNTNVTTNYLYICISNSIGNTPPNPGTTSTFWQFYTWDSKTTYNLNVQVTHYSRTYLSISSNTNKEPDTSRTYWTEIWNSYTNYTIYQIVMYNVSGIIDSTSLTYMAITSNNINNVPSSTSTYWAPKWISGTSYNIGNYVYYVNNTSKVTSIYICTIATSGSEPPVSSTNISGVITNTYNVNWQPYIWVSDYTYTEYQIVSYYGVVYMSIPGSNLNKQPINNPDCWVKEYSSGKIYSITDVVYHINIDIYNPILYMSLTNDNINNTPSDANNTTSWTIKYINGTLYKVGQFMYYTDYLIYLCIKDTTGTETPINSTGYWQPYIWNTAIVSPCPIYYFPRNAIVYYTSLSHTYTQTDSYCSTETTATIYYGYRPYLSLIDDNQNHTPGSFQSEYWAHNWKETIRYSINDIVYYKDETDSQNIAYKSLIDNNLNNVPESNSKYWVLYI